jgi:thiol-disulfide isomerase/thioredoxin
MPHFTLYSRTWCHLCDDMLQALRALAGETVSIEVLDVDADPALVEQYDELVPVLVGHRPGQPPVQLCHYHLDEAAVRGFLGRLVADSGLSTPESGKMRS